MSPTTAAWLALAFPLAGAIVNGLGFKVFKNKTSGVIGTAALVGAFVFAVIAFLSLQGRGEEGRQVVSNLYDYAVVGTIDAKLSILVDPLSVLMMLVVSGVSMLIHVYSFAYMSGDRGYTRFFAYLNFFVFSMLLLVLAANFLILIVGWAFVGAASYLLISFWYRRTTATSAGIKAFVINHVGDVGLTLGTFFILKSSHTLDFLGTFAQAKEIGAHHHGDLTAGLILLLVGAFAKSAQIPFHTWLPDAMEGPTPVSALIHAATMVTAGVYLIARMHPLFEQSVAAADVGTIVGCVTLLVAATIGMVVTDLKRVIAYSTMSQIGYMIMAVSSGAYVAGLFHLMTHAFFKALLFMSAGSVISAMGGEQNLDKMRGFKKAMPFTYGCFVIGGLALAGVPPFSGFFSKDDILLVQAEIGGWHWILYVVGYITALMTAFYTWRMIFRAFHGEPNEQAQTLIDTGHVWHAHEPTNPASGEVEDTDVGFPGPEHHIAEQAFGMKLAMGTLAVLATVGGVVGIPHVTTWLEKFLDPTFAGSTINYTSSDAKLTFGLILGAALGLLGIFIAYTFYAKANGEAAQRIQARLPFLHKLFVNKWYFDELIDVVVVRPFAWFGRFGQQTFERIFVNGTLVGGTSGLVRAGSAAVRALQSGFLRAYAALLVVGAGAVILYFLIQSS
ncbi:MAG TPA: NADH-quinone oxidoreductase subunit L [Baekduia sp.]|uniref:NADH-quinone oxidoreductase subunit L n=1 Tax=Baekduia sp. TaxID=2600305 RepID=UPI002D77E915|nr:NADH-quinone oxidoreductase subunit L [Baekduia sp.]HET6507206.1 NADH-quinone oxidoreductase subunit L [Baekduia sp.]